MNKIILVEMEQLEKYPPVISVMNCLSEMQICQLVLITVNASMNTTDYCNAHSIKLYNIEKKVIGNKALNLANKVIHYYDVHNAIWKIIQNEYGSNSLIWVFSVVSLKYLGNRLLKKKYVLHLFELVEKLNVITKLPIPKVNIGKFCRCAYRVVECEYNRAHITKTWFGLDKLPTVLPNKLFMAQEPDYKDRIEKPVLDILEALKDKKIILYQGIISPERPIGPFVEAIEQMDESFRLVIMTGSSVPQEWKEKSKVVIIPFIPAPYHLFVTQRAYIGILWYIPSARGYSYASSLNSIYCAPNKIYEYSRYGIPMIGNDIPGLKYTIEQFNCGVCLPDMNVESILDGIHRIENSYSEFKENSSRFFCTSDIETIISEEILGGCNHGD